MTPPQYKSTLACSVYTQQSLTEVSHASALCSAPQMSYRAEAAHKRYSNNDTLSTDKKNGKLELPAKEIVERDVAQNKNLAK